MQKLFNLNNLLIKQNFYKNRLQTIKLKDVVD